MEMKHDEKFDRIRKLNEIFLSKCFWVFHCHEKMENSVDINQRY